MDRADYTSAYTSSDLMVRVLRDATSLGTREQALEPVAATERLEPGMGIYLAQVWGDVIIGGSGTLSYVDGTRFLALGHPLSGAENGKSFAALIRAPVVTCTSFDGDLASVVDIGKVCCGAMIWNSQDGVAGFIGRCPPCYNMKIWYVRKGFAVSRNYHVTIAAAASALSYMRYVLSSTARQCGIEMSEIQTIAIAARPRASRARPAIVTEDLSSPDWQRQFDATIASFRRKNEVCNPELDVQVTVRDLSRSFFANRIP